MIPTFSFLFFSVSFVLMGSAHGAIQYNDRNFAELHKKYNKHVITPTPWSGFWYPYSDDGIAWQFGRDMSSSEKYDEVHRSNATTWEKRYHGTGRNVLSWYGHCNGWATAAILQPEPRKAKRVNGVVFETADQKALLAEAYQDVVADYIGTRSQSNSTNRKSFWDVTPAQFHLVLTNIAGKRNQSFILDRHTGVEVWNQPLVAYRIDPIRPEEYLGPHPRYGNIYRVNVTTTIWWANDEEVEPDSLTPPFKMERPDEFAYETRVLKYELWLDAPIEFDEHDNMVSSGNIITGRYREMWVGGLWKNSHLEAVNAHPDFIWIPYRYSSRFYWGNPRVNRSWIVTNFGRTDSE